MTLRTLPDVEALVIGFLRADPDVTALVGQRTYGRMPDAKTWPMVIVTRITSNMLVQTPPAEFEQVTIQCDAYGGPKAEAQDIAQTVRAALAHRLVEPPNGVAAIDLGPMGYLPDPDFEPPKARYTSDVLVTVRPST